jgi:hypothetical protein
MSSRVNLPPDNKLARVVSGGSQRLPLVRKITEESSDPQDDLHIQGAHLEEKADDANNSGDSDTSPDHLNSPLQQNLDSPPPARQHSSVDLSGTPLPPASPLILSKSAPSIMSSSVQPPKPPANNNGPIDSEEDKKRRRILKMTLQQLGEILASIIAVGCGVAVAANFIALGLLTGGLGYAVAGILFCAVTYINWLINKNSVPEVLVEMFGRKEKFRMLRKDAKGNPLSWGRTFLIWLGLLASLAAGVAQGVLAYNGTFTLTKGLVFLGVLGSGFFPPLAAILAGVTAICVTAMILKNIAALIRNPNVISECKTYLKDLFDFSPRPERKQRAKITIVSSLTQKAFNSTLDPNIDIHYYFLKEGKGVKEVLCYALKDARGNFTGEIIKLKLPDNEIPLRLRNLYAKLRSAKPYDYKGPDSSSTVYLTPSSKEEIKKLGNHPIVRPKSQNRIYFEKGLTIFLMVTLLPLASFGLLMTMRASAANLQAFMFKYIPHVSVVVVDVVAKGIMMTLAIMGRVIFTGRNSLRTITNLFVDQSKTQMSLPEYLIEQNKNAENQKSDNHRLSHPHSAWERISHLAACTVSLINAIGNGLISLMGALTAGLAVAFSWLAGFGGTWVSFSAGVSAGVLDGASPEKELLILNPRLSVNSESPEPAQLKGLDLGQPSSPSVYRFPQPSPSPTDGQYSPSATLNTLVPTMM